MDGLFPRPSPARRMLAAPLFVNGRPVRTIQPNGNRL
jgi:hypothetical protein